MRILVLFWCERLYYSGVLQLSASEAHDELEAHEKAMAMLKARVVAAEHESHRLEHEVFVAGQTAA